MVSRGCSAFLGLPQGRVSTSAIQRMSLAARCADQLRQGQTRWSALLRIVPKSVLVNVLARACTAGELTQDVIAARMHAALGRRWRWLPPLARRFVAEFEARTRPSFREAR